MSEPTFENRRATVSTWDGSFNFSLKKVSAVFSLIGTILGIMVLVYGSARAGVAAAVREEIGHQIEAPQSPLTRHVKAVINEHEEAVCEPRWDEVRGRLRLIENSNTAIETKLDLLLKHRGLEP